MLYNITTVKNGLYGVNGFQQDYRADQINIDTANLASSSGRFWNEFHPIITSENIYAIYPESENASPHHDFNDWLRLKIKSSIGKAVDTIYRKKKPDIKGILSNQYLFDNKHDMEDTIAAGTSFVGYEFELEKGRNLKLVLKKISAAFTTTQSITLYLFHSSRPASAVSTLTINSAANREAWTDITDINILYDDGTYVGGSWTIGYFQSTLTGQAIDRGIAPKKTEGVSIRMVTGDNISGTTLPDNMVESKYTWGLNFEVEMHADISLVITSMKNDWSNLLGYQFAYDMAMEIMYSNRNNEIRRQDGALTAISLAGINDRAEMGLHAQLKAAINEMDFDLSNLDPVLHPKRNIFYFTDL
jgi:hypothetical protein